MQNGCKVHLIPFMLFIIVINKKRLGRFKIEAQHPFCDFNGLLTAYSLLKLTFQEATTTPSVFTCSLNTYSVGTGSYWKRVKTRELEAELTRELSEETPKN